MLGYLETVQNAQIFSSSLSRFTVCHLPLCLRNERQFLKKMGWNERQKSCIIQKLAAKLTEIGLVNLGVEALGGWRICGEVA